MPTLVQSGRDAAKGVALLTQIPNLASAACWANQVPSAARRRRDGSRTPCLLTRPPCSLMPHRVTGALTNGLPPKVKIG